MENVVRNETIATLDRYQSGWNKLNELLRNGGSLSGREQNCCYLNLGAAATPRFADVSHVSGFDSLGDGRGLALIDWDRDGDLDIWMTNRTAPRVQFLRNESEPTRHFVSLRLEGTQSNRDAIGARVELEVEPSAGVLSRTVTAGDAYLSQSSKWLHFGLGNAQRVTSVRVRWPGRDGFISVSGVSLDHAYSIVEGEKAARPRRFNRTADASATLESKGEQNRRRNKMVVVGRLPLPKIELQIEGRITDALRVGHSTVVLLWSPDCPKCREELSLWAQKSKKIGDTGLEVLAISAAGEADTLQATETAIQETQFPFAWATVSSRQLELIEAYLSFLQQDYQRPLGVPMSLLMDRIGQAAVVYRGPVLVDDVLHDMSVLEQSPDEVRRTGIPFPGKWLRPLVRPGPTSFATQLSERFGAPTAMAYFEHLIQIANQERDSTQPYELSPTWKGLALRALGTIKLADGSFAEAADYSKQAQELLPKDFRPFADQGAALLKLGRLPEALAVLNKALELQPDRPSVLVNRATVYSQLGKHREAIQDWETLLRIEPNDERSRLSVAALAFATGDDQRSSVHYSEYLRRNPESTDAAGALAWILATSHDDSIRDGHRAVELASRWTSQNGGRDYKALNTLAAAFAENGQFGKAVEAIDRAIELTQRHGDSRATRAYRARRAVYLNQQPFRRRKPNR